MFNNFYEFIKTEEKKPKLTFKSITVLHESYPYIHILLMYRPFIFIMQILNDTFILHCKNRCVCFNILSITWDDVIRNKLFPPKGMENVCIHTEAVIIPAMHLLGNIVTFPGLKNRRTNCKTSLEFKEFSPQIFCIRYPTERLPYFIQYLYNTPAV